MYPAPQVQNAMRTSSSDRKDVFRLPDGFSLINYIQLWVMGK